MKHLRLKVKTLAKLGAWRYNGQFVDTIQSRVLDQPVIKVVFFNW